MAIMTMQEVKVGTSFLMEGQAFIALKSEFVKSGRNAAVMKMKIKNLLTDQVSEYVYKAADKVEAIDLELKPMQFSYIDGDNYVFMDSETYDQVEVPKSELREAANYMVDAMEIELAFYDGKAVDVRIPINVDREIIDTEPGIKGDTSGRSLKRAKINNVEGGFEIMVPLFCELGTKIKVDTRTGEYVERVKGA
jgi:elongation factor P